MNEEVQSEAVVPKQRCIACRQEIEAGATICVHCKTPQTWRRYLLFSSTVLSLLVALASVLGLTLPILQKSFHSPRSNITVSLLSVGDIKPRGGASIGDLWTGYTFMLTLQLALTNNGDAPGTLTAGAVELRVGPNQVASGRFTLAEPNNPTLPGTVRVAGMLVSLETSDIGLFPDKVRSGRDGRLLDASRETATGPRTSTLVGPIDLSGGLVTISAIQSDGKRDEFKLEIKPQKLSFTTL